MNKEPCSICELYVKGEKCEQESSCPVGLMKKENRSLKNRNTRLQKKLDEYSWDVPRELKINDMGWRSMSESIDKKVVQEALLMRISRLNADGEKAIPVARELIRFKRFVDGLTPTETVEVVKCKDCMYYTDGECKCGALPFSEFSDLANAWLTPKPDDYCSYGEREDGE